MRMRGGPMRVGEAAVEDGEGRLPRVFSATKLAPAALNLRASKAKQRGRLARSFFCFFVFVLLVSLKCSCASKTCTCVAQCTRSMMKRKRHGVLSAVPRTGWGAVGMDDLQIAETGASRFYTILLLALPFVLRRMNGTIMCLQYLRRCHVRT